MVKLMLYYWIKLFDRIYIFCPTYSKDGTWRCVDEYYTSGQINVYPVVHTDLVKKLWARTDKERLTNPNYKVLMYFDDCTGQPDFNCVAAGGIMNQLTSKGNHSGISSVYVVQKFTQCSTTMRTNAEGFLTFFTQSEAEKKYMWQEFGVGTYPYFKSLMDESTKQAYHNFFVNRQGPGMPDYYHNFKWIVLAPTSPCT
jgi:hypothetical protein